MTKDEVVEKAARKVAAFRMGLVKDPEGARLPDELWRQALPMTQTALRIAIPWAREQALREAAKVADEKYGDYRGNDYDNGSGASGYDEACHQIEVAILALINKRD